MTCHECGPWGECALHAPRLADGTERKPYAPMPGDIVAIDCKGIDPKHDQHGTRIGVFHRPSPTDEGLIVSLPGWAFSLCVDPASVTLVHRPMKEER